VPDLWYSVSATTRKRRPGEVDGVNYHFTTDQEFAELVAKGRLLEYAHFAGNHYGTPRDPVEERLAAGNDVLLEIEVQGARQVRASPGLGQEAVLIFLAPPSFDELARRLIDRGTEDPATQQARLDAARAELAAESEFDHTVVNTDVRSAAAGLVQLMAESRPGSPVR
jgi:guanylate kinase